ncbi:flagellin N-terminal helical domain-containing protein [Thiomicrorhabdus arctica]|jgi:flagellin|uniref:flagellin N-terminal helical domain-containing protein n=1 Tax=Thiomicrorhabdus arctica TaxID=131540 RepID=UPI0003791ACD|nr:flagellin [Thiomicrorhabdus arctica]
MAMVINTNIGSLNATRQLESSGKDLAVAMERLTSGQRINRAADDAAGLAVATNMTTQIKGTDQAVRNANDGISMAQTIDGAADEMSNMMQRQRELAVQSLNGTYSAANRTAMDAEFSALTSEIGRIASTTKFNGVSVMDTAVSTNIQVGWETNAQDSIAVTTIGGSSIATALGTVDVLTVTKAALAIAQIDTQLSKLNTARSGVGAVQNRLDHTVSNLQNISENVSAARSNIQDTDFAKESANLAKNQVLQQAGMSMLSQANQSSQNVLTLLR